jgi:hypothetical protein
MQAPSKSTVSPAGKSAGLLVVASGLWPEIRRLSGNCSRRSLDTTGVPRNFRSLQNSPRSVGGNFLNASVNYPEVPDNYTEARNNYPRACRSHASLPASCFNRRYNPTNGLANCSEGSSHCMEDLANCMDGLANCMEGLANYPEDLANCSEGLANCFGRLNMPRPVCVSLLNLRKNALFPSFNPSTH